MKCIICNKDFEGRADAKYCSANCRVKASRGGSKKEPVEKKGVVKNRGSKNKLEAYLEAQGISIRKGSELEPIEFVSSGIKEIDQMTGGFPRKRITEIYGMKGVGKTALMSRMLGVEHTILYIDTENAIVNVPENVHVVREYLLENVAEIVEVAVQSDAYDVIVIDSVASMTPRAEIEGETGEAHMGLKARLMGQWLRKLNPFLNTSKSAVVFINQQRDTMSAYGYAKFTPGGHALPYASSLRLELKTVKADRVIKNSETIGHWITVEVEKSRVCRPYQKTRFKLLYQ